MPTRITDVSEAADLTGALGPADPSGRAVALIGGADGLPPDEQAKLDAFFATLARYLEQTATAVVDGGTDSGVMRLIGTTRNATGGSFRLVGVTPRGALERKTSAGLSITIAPGHPEILLVPGSHFGDETELLFAAADHLGGGRAATIVVNGGRLTLEEAHLRLAAGHSVVTVAGTGRSADELAATVAAVPTVAPAADGGLRASGTLRVVPLTVDVEGLAAALEEGTDR